MTRLVNAKGEGSRVRATFMAVLVAAFLVFGLLALAGCGGGSSSKLGGKTSVPESELDSVIATYTVSGKTSNITVREAISQNSSLESAKDTEGNYRLPSAENVISLVRNRIIEQEAEKRGVTVSDEELAAYAEETLGTSDYASIATSYGMDEDGVKTLLTSSAEINKLRTEIVGEENTVTAPEPPTPPANNATTAADAEDDGTTTSAANVATKEYADYIIKLAGEEWDASTNSWASVDGPYAMALSTYQISPSGATYEAAQSAYYVAYQQYSQAQTDVSSKWSDFVNGLLSNTTMNLNTLVS